MKMTFDEYDVLTEKFDKIVGKTCWPSEKVLKKLENDIDKYIPFLCFLLEQGTPPENEEEKASKKYINRLVQEHLELID